MASGFTQERLDEMEQWLKDHPDIKEAAPDLLDDRINESEYDEVTVSLYRRVLRRHGRLKDETP